ncbi:MAG TPA: MFS transporter [Dehalococcoidia bacterium]|nr:MFS transporter [Dehalococcoidia bacterium]
MTNSAVARALAGRLPFFYGWVIVSIAFLSVFLTGATSFWGLPIFVGPMHQDTGWSHASILGGLAVRFITGAICGLFLGRFADARRGPALMMFAGAIIDGAALASLRWAESPLQFLLLYGLVGGAGGSGMRMFQATLVPKWFVFRRGSAIGVAALGGGASALLMVPLVAFFIDAFGWRDAWTWLGLIEIGVMLPCAFLIVRAPEDIGLLPDDGATPPGSARATASSERSYTLAEAVRTWRMWLLLLGVVFGAYALNTNSVVLVPYYEEIGFSSSVAASAMSAYGFASVSTRLVWGYVADRFTVRRAMIFQGCATGLAALLLLQIEGRASLYLVSALQGTLLSGFPTLSSLVWPTFFGRRHLGSIVGVTQLFSTIASASGPLLAGFIFDSTGTYETTVWMLFGAWLICAAIIFAVRPAREPTLVAEGPGEAAPRVR